MSTLAIGSMHIDYATHRLLIDGEPACDGCGRPSATRFCSHVCEVKRAAERQWLRRAMPPIAEWARTARALLDEAGVR